ncbi:MAG: hypothetical protein D6725_09085 [Planctomycetota bacterium]|nr:MAG: hypothetical protein D6725_09085 [Planctomycetota bacterium]
MKDCQSCLADVERQFAETQAELAHAQQHTPTNPQKSSVPPSTVHPHAKRPRQQRKNSNRKRGGQPGHSRHERPLVPPEDVTDIIPLKPDVCRRCGEPLSGDDPDPLRHQVFEIAGIRPIITEYQRHRLTCPCCGVTTTASLPDGVPTGQSGPRLTAFVALLTSYFRHSKRRAALFIESVFGIPCSVGPVTKLEKLALRAVRPCYEQMLCALPRSDVVAMDETPSKQEGAER